MSTVIGVIPSRWGSTRLEGKPLQMLCGKPMIEWVLKGVSESKLLTDIIVATDDDRIASVVKELGHKVAMTSSSIPTGTDRCYEAIKNSDADIIVNIQGDEPLIEGWVIDKLIEPMLADNNLEMATLACEISSESEYQLNSVVKVVKDKNNNAIYFSRAAIPYTRESFKTSELCLKHIGLYAYRSHYLSQFCNHEPTQLELSEGLEQLRALHMGAKIKVVKVDHQSWGLDTSDDISVIENKLNKKIK